MTRMVRAALFAGFAAAGALAGRPSLAAPEPQPLALEEAVAIALAESPQAAAAEAREHAAWAALDRAEAERLPQLRLEGRYTHLSDVPEMSLPGAPPIVLAEPDSWVASATAQQLLWSGGRVAALVDAAERGARALRAARTRSRQLVVHEARRAFRLLVAAQEQEEAAARTLEAAAAQRAVAASRLEARAAARFDLVRADVAVAEARQEAIRAAGGRETAHALLLQALGRDEGRFIALAPPPPAAGPARPLDALLDAARARRPEIRAAARRLEAAAAGVRAARAERLPTIGLAADYQNVSPESRTLLSRWSAGVYASLPVLDGGKVSARVAEAEAREAEARADLAAARRRAEAEVRRAFAQLASARAQVTVARERVGQGEELARLADVRYREGVGTATEAADAQASLARARYGLARAGAELGMAADDLELAAGETPVEPPRTGEGSP